MITEKFSIDFPFQVENGALIISIRADVEPDQSDFSWLVSNFRLCSTPNKNVLPDVHLRRLNGHWVHVDSEKETYLSVQVGKAIDAHHP
jgi:hypothetical protein